MCVLGCCDSIPHFFFTVAVVFSMVLRQHCFSKRIETVCVCVGGAVTACLSCFFKVAATAFFVKTH